MLTLVTRISPLAVWALVGLEMLVAAPLAIGEHSFANDLVGLTQTVLLATIPLHSFPRAPTVMLTLHG